jgi:GH25 family lysozyme M1 (1,4-beta-N-acetylmuramidase)
MITGIDLSGYKTNVDYSKLNANAAFAIVRAGYGVTADQMYSAHWSNITVPKGSYWYWSSLKTAQSQADKWQEVIGADTGELPLFADIEENYGGAYGNWSDILEFLTAMEGKYPNKPIYIYTRSSWWRERIPASKYSEFLKFQLWVANYGVLHPAIYPWTDWIFWQYAGDSFQGKIYGMSTCDLNYFNGSSEDFEKMFGVASGSSNSIDRRIMKGTALISGINVKPMTGGVTATQLAVGEVVYGDLSSQESDLINITKVFQSDGVTVRMELPMACKVSIGDWLSVTVGEEPDTTPPPADVPSVMEGTFTFEDTDGHAWQASNVVMPRIK